MIPYCKARGIGIIPWWPLQGGDLARPVSTKTPRKAWSEGTLFERPPSDADITIINRVEEVAKKKGWDMSQVALAWVASKIDSPIVGCSSIGRLHSAIISTLR